MWERQNFCLLNFPNLENHLYVDLERHIDLNVRIYILEKKMPQFCVYVFLPCFQKPRGLCCRML